MYRLHLILLCCIFLNGCSSALLPEVEQTTESAWNSFEEIKTDFDRIQPMQTHFEDLKEMGFDPFEAPNVMLINYLELIERFIPNSSITMDDLPKGVKQCLQARADCYGLLVNPKRLDSKRYGNAFLDVLNFKRKTRITGWEFEALLVLQEDLVMYKLWSGDPKILKHEKKTNPLGPLQDIGTVFSQIN